MTLTMTSAMSSAAGMAATTTGVPASAAGRMSAPAEARVPTAVEAGASVRASPAPSGRRRRHTNKDKRCDKRK